MTDVNFGKTVIKLPQGSEIDYFECDREQLMHIAVKFEAMISALLKLCQDNEKANQELREELNKLKPSEPVPEAEFLFAKPDVGLTIGETVAATEGETAPGAYPY